MNIISHRGAAGLAPENSKQAISLGANLGAKYVEFDVQKTLDNKLVVLHNLATPSGKPISKLKFSQIVYEIPELVILDEALDLCKPSPALIEIKSDHKTAELILPYLKKYSESAITTFFINELKVIKNNSPSTFCFLMQRKHPYGLIKKALHCHANGIGINKNWFMLLPLINYQTKKHNLKLFIYTLNNKFIAKIINKLYPEILICTDNPHKLI